ncbi:uncharacterized mitochondrial protein AtMg00810-like [Rutidosis leptorrhynchoides]|uniref:uncharacterized mitochondrial protein AtMg00810-like n=1 Tax=Rutidosis leptorrhynchoides TaxID=125765 RepID=UPI003A99B66C
MSNIYKPKTPFNLNATSTPLSPIPKTPIEALNNPNWKLAMSDEFAALINNKTWDLIPREPNMHVIRSMWIFKHKFRSNGSFERYKARLVGDGRLQQVGIDCMETFSPVVKPATIRVVLSLALSHSWQIRQLDVKNAFLHVNLQETLYMHQPMGFRDPTYPDYVCRFFLNQSKYAKEILDRAGMSNCKPCNTPVEAKSKLSSHIGNPYADPSLYRSLAGALQYLTFTRPDILYSVQQICLHMHNPHDTHMAELKRILKYVQGTIDYGLHMTKTSTTSLIAYTDADWAGCPDTRKSTSGYCVYLGDNLISWSSKRQPTISRSSTEAEYRGVAKIVSESCWLRNLLLELHHPLQSDHCLLR